MPKGLYNKYTVTKNEGETDLDACYFVLRLDTDPVARAAAYEYAKLIYASDPLLARQINHLIVSLTITGGSAHGKE